MPLCFIKIKYFHRFLKIIHSGVFLILFLFYFSKILIQKICVRLSKKWNDTLVFYSGTITNYDFRRNNEEKNIKK